MVTLQSAEATCGSNPKDHNFDSREILPEPNFMVFPGPLNHRTHPPGLQAVVAHFRVGPGLNCAWWEGDMVTSSTSTSSHPRSLWKKCQNCPTTRGQTILDISKEMHCSIQNMAPARPTRPQKSWLVVQLPTPKLCAQSGSSSHFTSINVCACAKITFGFFW